ncbi:MAG: S1C family serine protease [Akkermansiaceae bacterium]|jgi:serine protease Do|nr:S1C family serine protease [Akkermansiaceae bacterium]MDP4647170.1 S1C family serine protease [Akkermansiaceae bacterium]MDP4720042.1 S1C family serine protease [Akkermansiaceae bacterium]MDP4780464.1 S1C family serine protease [Akkermansiaceae bacterium]MDP4847781.1 S1C family serine protease [Akkermansiaceae bacterium]
MSKIAKALILSISLGLPPLASAFPLNSKKAPESLEDLLEIQAALQAALPNAEAATVCVDLGEGTGSGVIVSKDGLVMTAAHVSTAVGKKVTIIMEDGTKLKAETLGLMAETDAALIQILEDAPNENGYPFVEVNQTDDTKLGDWVFSLGHSGGFKKERGAVVRIARLVRMANNTIQTDGTLIGGDSGGPLFDMDGRLIGIHSRVGPQLPVNMHVPVRVFLDSWDRMMKSEFIGEGPFAQKPEIGKGFLGVGTEPVDGGLEITKVGKGSPAENEGLVVGDVIKSFNGEKTETKERMKELLAEMAPGDKLELEIIRDGKNETIKMQLGSR